MRDRALLIIGFAGAFRRSELVALDVEDIDEVVEDLRSPPVGETDQEGKGSVVAIVTRYRLPSSSLEGMGRGRRNH